MKNSSTTLRSDRDGVLKAITVEHPHRNLQWPQPQVRPFEAEARVDVGCGSARAYKPT
jgi:hypothetical protein